MREPGPPLAIRRAGPSDVPVLQGIVAAAYERYLPRIGRPPAPMTADYAAIVARGHAWLATRGTGAGDLAIDSAQRAGYAQAAGAGDLAIDSAQPPFCPGVQAAGLIVLVPAHNYLLLENVAVMPWAQGHGVGRALLRFAEDHARSLGLSEIRLYTHAAMTENLAYYPRRGYVETGRGEQDGFSRVFFAKAI